MAIDFTLTPEQRQLQLSVRELAQKVLGDVDEQIRHLPSPDERFAATRPAYEQLVQAGLLQQLIPAPAGGKGTGMVEMAIVAEELHAVDPSVSLTMFGTLLGLLPCSRRQPEAAASAPVAVSRATGAPLAAFCFSEPGGSANFDAPAPAEGCAPPPASTANEWVIRRSKQWVSSAIRLATATAPICCASCVAPRPTRRRHRTRRALGDRARSPERGIVVEGAIDCSATARTSRPRFRFDDVRAPLATTCSARSARRKG